LGHNVLSLNAYLSESYSTSRRVLRSYRQATVCAARVLRCTYVIIDYMPYVRGPVPCAALPPGLRPECESEPRIAWLSLAFRSAAPLAARGAGFIPAKMAEKSFLRRLVSRVDGAPRALN
jgi:hypothetical protein